MLDCFFKNGKGQFFPAIHGKTILSMEFKSMIKAHDLISWQIIYQKAQFSLVILEKSLVFTGNIRKKSSSHWQH